MTIEISLEWIAGLVGVSVVRNLILLIEIALNEPDHGEEVPEDRWTRQLHLHVRGLGWWRVLLLALGRPLPRVWLNGTLMLDVLNKQSTDHKRKLQLDKATALYYRIRCKSNKCGICSLRIAGGSRLGRLMSGLPV